MTNYIEYNDTIAFHPGYYIKEIVEESSLDDLFSVTLDDWDLKFCTDEEAEKYLY